MNYRNGARPRVALVTGANSGIGLAISKQLSSANWHVLAAVRNLSAAAQVEALASSRITPLSLDICDEASISALRERVMEWTGSNGLSALVNCAGIIVEGPLELIPVRNFRRQFEVNVVGPFALTRSLLPALRKGRGRVINIGAVSARTTAPFFGPISASKAALASLTDAMRMEFAPFGIHVALIEPGGIRTAIWQTSAALLEDGLKEQEPELVDAYRPAIQAMRAAFAKAGADSPQVVAQAAVVSITSGRKPKARQLVGKGASQFALVGRIPQRFRDRLLMSSLGITKALKPAIDTLR